ncbi:tol-pal system protein YbgF [Dethiosulfatarculus sandiegensis]|uniref:Tol-pal system protein YbgF n=1 Tax=Dethiosulfatarculus sandiegensis TaxID=1429043 RepID=A0A0D2J8T5_9BACT|nr:tol-pal system protein YbgF [Dethiosulfatarculus sandiegensis]KIX14574.1 tol-pal system protein YbgF [Dethiosulfatarculus sandiegensis]
MNQKSTFLFALLATLVFMGGCAAVEREEFVALQGQVYNNQKTLDSLSKRQDQSRRPQAELTAKVNALSLELAKLRGQVEETAYRMNQLPNSQAINSVEEKNQAKLAEIVARLEKLENYLGVDKKSGKPTLKPAPAPKAKPANTQASAQKPTTAKAYYALGHKLRKQKSFQAARDQYSALIKKFPKSQLTPSAHYWIGDTYYEEKKFEEAILAYNQVIKRYPKSSKASSALLKQGLSFSALGDKRTAKIVLKKLIKNHPKTSQAKLAKKILARMK